MAAEGMALAAKQAIESRRNWLKRPNVFEKRGENKFINPPKIQSEISLELYDELKAIKENKKRRTKIFEAQLIWLIRLPSY